MSHLQAGVAVVSLAVIAATHIYGCIRGGKPQ